MFHHTRKQFSGLSEAPHIGFFFSKLFRKAAGVSLSGAAVIQMLFTLLQATCDPKIVFIQRNEFYSNGKYIFPNTAQYIA